MLAGDGAAYREHLLSLGLELAPGKFARDCLQEDVTLWRPDGKACCVHRTGWHGQVFVLPDATYGDTGGESVILQTAGTMPVYELAGTLEGWRDQVARLAVGNSRLAVALSLAFAGPLLFLLGDESGGLHLTGGSSTGKTTALFCAASVWGCPVRSWRATDNAAEGLAHGASDAFLPLDEVIQADGRAVDAMAYMLGNGVGKARMCRDTTVRQAITWRLPFLSTGETGLAAKMQEAGRRARAGQEVRVVELPADAGRG
jgi:putative DNA primase/helicase